MKEDAGKSERKMRGVMVEEAAQDGGEREEREVTKWRLEMPDSVRE